MNTISFKGLEFYISQQGEVKKRPTTPQTDLKRINDLMQLKTEDVIVKRLSESDDFQSVKLLTKEGTHVLCNSGIISTQNLNKLDKGEIPRWHLSKNAPEVSKYTANKMSELLLKLIHIAKSK